MARREVRQLMSLSDRESDSERVRISAHRLRERLR